MVYGWSWIDGWSWVDGWAGLFRDLGRLVGMGGWVRLLLVGFNGVSGDG